MMNNMSQGLGSFNNMMPQNNMQQNPYGQQMNPQMMGQQVRSPEMFSEQLMNPMMPQMQDPLQGLQPMAEPEGFGVYGQSLSGFADGGAASSGGVPRETVIGGQPHMLAYINPEEEQMLYAAGGSGEPGPGGIPAFIPDDGNRGSSYAPRTSPRPRARPADLSSSMARASSQSAAELAYMARARRAAQQSPATQQAEANIAAQKAAVEKQAAQQAEADRRQVLSDQRLADQQRAQQAAATQLSNQQMTGQGTGQGTGQVYPFGSPLPGRNVSASILTTNDVTPLNANLQLESYFPVGGPNTVINKEKPVDGAVTETNQAEILASSTEKPRRTFEQFLNDLAAPPVYDDTTINFDTYGDARAAYNETKDEGRSKFGIPSLLGSAAQAAGGFMAMAGGIRDTDKYAGRDAVTGQQIFETKPAPFNGKSTFYVIDGRTGLVRNVESATDASNNQADMDRQRDSLKVMMDNASSNNSAEELAYVAAKQAEEQAAVNAINNPVVASSYSPTALTRAGIGGGSNVGSFYDTTPNVV
jgi:hypothetical protein